MPDGTCEECSEYERAQDDGKKCGPDPCTDR